MISLVPDIAATSNSNASGKGAEAIICSEVMATPFSPDRVPTIGRQARTAHEEATVGPRDATSVLPTDSEIELRTTTMIIGPDAATPTRPYMLTTTYSKQVVESNLTAIIGSDTVATGHAGALMIIDSKASVSLETTAPGPYTEAAVVLVADTIDSKVTISADIAPTSDLVAVMDLIAEAETETAMHTGLDEAAVYPDQIANVNSISAVTRTHTGNTDE